MSIGQKQFTQIFLDLNKFFASIDTDDDGYISKAELKAFLTQMGIAEEDHGKIFTESDTEWYFRKIIGSPPFIHLMIRAFIHCPEMKMLSNQMDEDKSGYVTVDELITFIKNSESTLTEEQIREKFVEFDTDKDGKINPVEVFQLYSSIGMVERTTLWTTFIPLLSFVYSIDNDKDGKISLSLSFRSLNDVGISYGKLDDVRRMEEYNNISEMRTVDFMHFCADVWMWSYPGPD